MSTQPPNTPKTTSTSKPIKSSKQPKHPNNIRTAIQHSPWNFNQVAEKTKIPRDTLVDYCAGKYPVPYNRLRALSQVLDVLPEYLVPPLPNLREAYWSQSQHEETKDLEALLLLRTHCHLHPTDENALQQLMELLGKVGRYPEIEKWYEKFVKEVKKEDIWRSPDADTTALLTRLRAQSTLSTSSPIEGTIPMMGVLVKGESDTDPLRRKLGGFLKQTTQAGLVGAFAPEFLGRTDLLQRLVRAVTRPSLIGTTLLEELRSSVTTCYRLQPEIVGMVSSDHLTTAHTHLAYLIELLETSLYPSVRQQLSSLAAECSLIIGVMYHNMHLPTVAERYFTTACTAAEEADNLALKAVIYGRMSFLPGHSLAIVQEALLWAKQHGTDTTYSWLQARNAEVYTEHLLVDVQYATECEKALEQATAFSSKGDPEHDPYWTCFDECLMYGYQGACYAKLQKPEAAKIALLQALQLSNPQNTYHQTDLQTDLARVYQLQGDMINACLCGHHALLLISRTHSLGHLQGLEDFRSKFPPGQTDAVLQAFDEHKRSVEELLHQHTHFEEMG